MTKLIGASDPEGHWELPEPLPSGSLGAPRKGGFEVAGQR